MSNVMRLSPIMKPLQMGRPMSFKHSLVTKVDYSSSPNILTHFSSEKIHLIKGRKKNSSTVEAKAVAIDDMPVSVELQPISSETHFHQLVDEAQQQSVVVVWVASWCRKCKYLKPKLEKLAADYYPSVGFFAVDVNDVSHKLVAFAGVTKMPTIQVWKDGMKQAEVIGGHKAYLVVNEVREIIENSSLL